MLSEADKALRRTGITSTDIVRLMGVGISGGPADVYREKMFPDAVPATSDDPDYFKIGHLLEPIAIQLLQDKRPTLRVAHNVETKVHPNARYLATPDALVYNQSGQLIGCADAKAVGPYMLQQWMKDDDADRGVPERVLIQITWHCLVTGTKEGFASMLCGTEHRAYDLGYSEDLALELQEVADRFWTDHIAPQKPPAPDGTEGAAKLLKVQWPENKKGLFKEANAVVAQYAQRYDALKKQISDLEGEREQIKQLLQSEIGDAEGILGEGWKATWALRPAVEIKATTRAAYRHFDLRFAKKDKK